VVSHRPAPSRAWGRTRRTVHFNHGRGEAAQTVQRPAECEESVCFVEGVEVFVATDGRTSLCAALSGVRAAVPSCSGASARETVGVQRPTKPSFGTGGVSACSPCNVARMYSRRVPAPPRTQMSSEIVGFRVTPTCASPATFAPRVRVAVAVRRRHRVAWCAGGGFGITNECQRTLRWRSLAGVEGDNVYLADARMPAPMS